MAVTIVNAGYRSTNVWVLSAGRSRLLVDLGWPGQIGALLANLQRLDVPLAEVTHGIATHYHIDHAGCAEELKGRGMCLVVTPEQLTAVSRMAQWTKPADRYVPITPVGNRVVPIHESRTFLRSLGLDGELLHTPGHSDDSITVVLDSGQAFTGDLTLPALADGDDSAVVRRSWQALADRGVTDVHAGHGPVRRLSSIWRGGPSA